MRLVSTSLGPAGKLVYDNGSMGLPDTNSHGPSLKHVLPGSGLLGLVSMPNVNPSAVPGPGKIIELTQVWREACSACRFPRKLRHGRSFVTGSPQLPG